MVKRKKRRKIQKKTEPIHRKTPEMTLLLRINIKLRAWRQGRDGRMKGGGKEV